MEQKTIFGMGIALVVITIIGLGYWFWQVFPSDEDISNATITVTAVDRNILQNKTFEKVSAMNQNGNLPISVSTNDAMKNPF